MSEGEEKVILTTSGPVKGITIEGITSYLGIPYAAPPADSLRWKPPIAVEPWKEPRLMGSYGPACPQTEETLMPRLNIINENCLILNIWTPAVNESEKLPVMMFIHGGGFAHGRGSDPMFNTPHLSKKGVVLVSINYRLSALGFLAHPTLTAESPHHSSGNYGILDQVMALKWIKENIVRFGGDPDNVTIFGQSAGGASVIALMASPLSKGLFHRAIAQSCSYAPPVIRHLSKNQPGLDSMETLHMRFIEQLEIKNKDNPLKELRAMPWEKLVYTWEKAVQNKQAGTRVTGSWMLNHLTIDGYVLKEAPGKVFIEGKQHNVPFMTGTTLDEGSVLGYLMNVVTIDKYFAYLERCFGEQWHSILERYPANDDSSAKQAARKLISDTFVAGSRAMARTMAAIQPRTYLYQFTMPPKIFIFKIPGIKDRAKELGCYHSAELPYVFHFLPGSRMTDDDRKLSEEMMGYWVRFARSADPNGNNAPFWPHYDLSTEKHLVLNNIIKEGQHLNKEACDTIDEIVNA
jgi:para-nitrobenzyl esterase